MTQTLTVRVGADGVLTVALGEQNANKIVRLTFEVPDRPPMSHEEWRQFIERTAGAIADPTFQRHPQGEYEQRDEL